MRQTNTISFDDQYEDRHTAVVAYPEELVFADSAKCTVEARLFDQDETPEYNQEVMLTVKENGQQVGYSEVRILDSQGRASFDIARYVQMILGDPDDDGTFDYSENSALVTQKLIQVTLTAFGTTFFTQTFNAVHGINKVLDRWWSKERKIRWWPAYPFAFDFVNTDQVKKKVGDAISTVAFPQVGTSLSHARARVKASVFGNSAMTISVVKDGIFFSIAGSTDTGHVPGTKLFNLGDNSVSLIPDSCPADPNAAYLRWMDRHCELRHWLFSKYRDTDTVQATEDRRAGFDPDRFIDGVARDGRMRDGTLTKELTVNTGMLQEWEYDLVESIANAPFVDMLDMESYLADGTILWQRLSVKPGSFTKPLRNRHASDQNLQMAVTLQYDGERSIGV
jgi:hypothetical protein